MLCNGACEQRLLLIVRMYMGMVELDVATGVLGRVVGDAVSENVVEGEDSGGACKGEETCGGVICVGEEV